MGDEISIKRIIEVVIKSRLMLFSFFLLAAIISFYFYFTTPKSYTAEATIIPIASEGGGFADFLAGTGLGMLTHSETKANVLLVVLESQTLAENVLSKFNIVSLILNKPEGELKPVDKKKAAELLRKGMMKFVVTKNGAIAVYASLREQDKVADLANHYLEELAIFIKKNSINMNFVVMDEAQKPLFPSEPNLLRNLTVSLFVAFFFSLIYLSFNLLVIKK